ncbi:MAG: hypothetical protein EOO91_09565 [Pedobacter sp.]|nr:MAG: hypothetical protein EOO91_09565 [Pedobacter sp.]
MKKIILTSALMIALVATMSLQSCNSEKKAETTDSPAIDTNVADTTVTPQDTTAIDTGSKGTKVPAPKNEAN